MIILLVYWRRMKYPEPMALSSQARLDFFFFLLQGKLHNGSGEKQFYIFLTNTNNSFYTNWGNVLFWGNVFPYFLKILKWICLKCNWFSFTAICNSRIISLALSSNVKWPRKVQFLWVLLSSRIFSYFLGGYIMEIGKTQMIAHINNLERRHWLGG